MRRTICTLLAGLCLLPTLCCAPRDAAKPCCDPEAEAPDVVPVVQPFAPPEDMPPAPRPPGPETYAAAYRRAREENKPLLVWLNFRSHVEDQLPGMVHVYSGPFLDEVEPCVIVSRPGDGCMIWVATIRARDVTAEAVRRALNPPRAQYVRPHPRYAPVFVPRSGSKF